MACLLSGCKLVNAKRSLKYKEDGLLAELLRVSRVSRLSSAVVPAALVQLYLGSAVLSSRVRFSKKELRTCTCVSTKKCKGGLNSRKREASRTIVKSERRWGILGRLKGESRDKSTPKWPTLFRMTQEAEITVLVPANFRKRMNGLLAKGGRDRG